MRPVVYRFDGEGDGTVLVPLADPCCPVAHSGEHPAGGSCCRDEAAEGCSA